MTDEEIEANALSDPDALPMTDAELAEARPASEVLRLRMRLGLSQAAFAKRFHINLRTIQDWEQGRRVPEEIARVYLKVIGRNPGVVAAALED
jgi:putative transcriptional regulator